MRIINGFILLLIFGFTSAGFAENSEIQEYKLSNGLKLVVKVDNRAPVVMSQIWYKVGSRYEGTGITGISHMLEHMMFRGTKKFPSGQLKKIIVDHGGILNAATSNDYTMYYTKIAADKLPLIFELEADRMDGLLLNQKDFVKEKQVVLEERNMRLDDDPEAKTEERFFATAFLSNPYRHLTIGWKHDIQNLTVTDLRHWYTTWYVPNNAIVIVIGAVKPDEVYKLARKYYGSIKSHPLPPLKPQKEIEPLGPRNLVVNFPAKLPWLIMGFNTPSLKSTTTPSESYTLEVISAVLDLGNSSRFSRKLVRGSEIATNITTTYSLYSSLDNLFIITANPTPQSSVRQLAEFFLQEIRLLQTFLIASDELNRAKTQLIANKTYQEDALDFQADEIGILESSEIPWVTNLQYEKNIRAVTPQQIREVARKYLTEKRLTIGILQPIQGK